MTARADACADEERILVRTESGQLFDTRTRESVTLVGLAADVRCGRLFRAEDRDGGECTYQVLAQVLLAGLVPTAPGPIRARGPSEPWDPLSDPVGEASPS